MCETPSCDKIGQTTANYNQIISDSLLIFISENSRTDWLHFWLSEFAFSWNSSWFLLQITPETHISRSSELICVPVLLWITEYLWTLVQKKKKQLISCFKTIQRHVLHTNKTNPSVCFFSPKDDTYLNPYLAHCLDLEFRAGFDFLPLVSRRQHSWTLLQSEIPEPENMQNFPKWVYIVVVHPQIQFSQIHLPLV